MKSVQITNNLTATVKSSFSTTKRNFEGFEGININLTLALVLLGANSNLNSPIGLRTYRSIKITLYKLPMTSLNEAASNFFLKKEKKTNGPLDLIEQRLPNTKKTKTTVILKTKINWEIPLK